MRFITILLCFTAFCSICSAEIIELIDGTKISGTVIHAYRESLEIEGNGGERIIMPLVKIKSVQFKRIEPRPEFSTPEKALAHYLDLVRKGEMKKTIECYRLMYQKMMTEQMIAMTEIDKAGMQEELIKTEFEIGKAEINGSKAYIPVIRIFEGQAKEAEMVFILENGEWKMAMPSMPNETPAEKLSKVTITLKDDTSIEGIFLHYYNGVFHLKGETGGLIELEKSSVKTFTPVSPGPRPEFSTPEKTFSLYLSLLKQGKMAESAECFRLMVQSVMLNQLASMTPQQSTLIREETAKLKFKYGKADIKENSAVLKVTMTSGKQKQTVDISFTLENGEWKMTMMPGIGGMAPE